MSMPMRWDQIVVPEAPVLTETPLRRRRDNKKRRGLHLLLAMSLCTVVGGMAVVGAQTFYRSLLPAPGLRLSNAPTSSASVLLASSEVDRNVGFVSVIGSVANTTDKSIADVEAVVELLDAQNKTLRVESALIAFDALPARSSSPFHVEMVDDSRAVAYRVHFKRLLGPALN